jgi:hypothetical protein
MLGHMIAFHILLYYLHVQVNGKDVFWMLPSQ